MQARTTIRTVACCQDSHWSASSDIDDDGSGISDDDDGAGDTDGGADAGGGGGGAGPGGAGAVGGTIPYITSTAYLQSLSACKYCTTAL